MKNHYVYLTTNLITRQQYVGDHTINNAKQYLGSGIVISEAIKKYGECNFFKEILEWFDTRIDACKAQEKYIKLYQTHVLNGGYNISWTGGTHCGGSHSTETIQLMKINSIGKNKGIIRKPSTAVEYRKKEKELLLKIKKEIYEKHPNYCKECNKKINFNNRPQSFCSQTCVALFNSKQKQMLSREKYNYNSCACCYCHKSFDYKNRHKKYCNDKCKENQRQNKIMILNNNKQFKYQERLLQKNTKKQLMRELHFKEKELNKIKKQLMRELHFKEKKSKQ